MTHPSRAPPSSSGGGGPRYRRVRLPDRVTGTSDHPDAPKPKRELCPNITAADVKKLRDLTGAGMMDCKKALDEAEGDFDKAVEILRVKGAKDVGKRAGRPPPTAWWPTPARRCWS